MTKLPAVRPREVIRFLEQKGFILDRASGSHFIFYHRFQSAGPWSLNTTVTC